MLVPDARVGDFVLVHAGFAIAVLESEDAAERLALFDEIVAMGADDEAPRCPTPMPDGRTIPPSSPVGPRFRR